MDLAELRVVFNATDLKRGEAEGVRAFGNVGRAADQTTDRIRNQGRVYQDLERQARAALEKMGVAQDKVGESMRRMGFGPAAAGASTLTRAVEQNAMATTNAAAGNAKLRGAAQALALSMAGLPGPLGRVTSLLGSLAVGGGITLAVTAGIGLIVAGYEALTREAREAKAATDDLIQSLAKAARERSGTQFGADESSLLGRLSELRQKRDLPDVSLGAPGRRQKIIDEIKEVELALGALYTRRADEYVDSIERQNRKDRERAAEAKRLREEEDRARQKAWDDERTRNEQRIESEKATQRFLTDTTIKGIEERAQAIASRKKAAGGALSAQLDAEIAVATGSGPVDQNRLAMEEEILNARLRENAALVQSRSALIGVVESLALLPPAFTGAAAAANDLVGELDRMVIEGKKFDELNLAETFNVIALGIQGIATGGKLLKSIFGDPGGDALKAFQQRIADYESYKSAEKGFLSQGLQKSPLELLDEQYLNLLVTAQRLRQPTDALTKSWQEQRRVILDQIEAANAAAEAEKKLADERRLQQEQIDRFAREGRWASIDEARAGLAKDPAAIAQAQFQGRVAGVRGQFASGAISQEELDAWLDIFGQQLANALQETADAAEAAAQAVRDFNTATQASLSVQALQYQAIIDGTEASQRAFEDAERELRQDTRMNELRKNGADAATLASQQYVDTLEDLAVATRRNREEAEALRREQEATRRFNADLDVRGLRAGGFTGLADDLAFQNQQADEYAQAVAGGRSPADLARLASVQTAERVARDQARRQAQEQAFADAVGANFSVTSPSFASDSQTGVNLAVGISEATGGRMAGLLASQLAYQASLPRMETLLRRLVAIEESRGTGSQYLTGLDEGLALLGSGADAAAGNPPSNR